MENVLIKEPVKSKLLQFLNRRINSQEARNRNNKTSIGRLKDLVRLIEADMPINNPPLYIQRKIQEFM